MTIRKINLDVIDEDSASEAIDIITKIAKESRIAWALVGGLAMNLYGSDRLTKDIDVISTKRLPMSKEKVAGQLRQGGERYNIKTSKRDVPVDWIIRADEFNKLFAAALSESVRINDIPILTPEWLVILKFIAGRFKDQEDAVFLLSRKDLVDRDVIKSKMIKHVGRTAWGLARHGYKRWFDMADGRTLEEERNEKDGYIDS